MNESQKKFIEQYLKVYCEKSNNSWGNNEMIDLHNYWKGQVMGMCKIITTMKLDIDINYYLSSLH